MYYLLFCHGSWEIAKKFEYLWIPWSWLHITSHPKRMCSSVVISADFISEYTVLSRSTTMYMEVGPHHSSSQEREQKSYGELPPNIIIVCNKSCRICGKDPCGTDFWSDLNLFNLNQFAYLRGKSTLAQLLTCYNDWAKARNRSQQTDIIFLDLSEAFDSVPHERFIVAETTKVRNRWLSISVN